MKPRNKESGLAEKLYIAPLSWLDEVKSAEPPYLQPGDEVCIFNDHRFKPGKGFLQVRLQPEKNKYQAAPIGEKGALTLTHTLEAVIPGSYAMLHSVIAGLTNIPVVALIKDSNCGESWHYQFGGCRPAYMTPTFTTGTTADGTKGYTVQIALNRSFVELYFGAIPIFEAELIPLKPVFIAPQRYSGGLTDYAAVRRAFFERRVTDIEAVFQYIQYMAGDQIVTIALANDKGLFVTDTYNEFPVTNYGDFLNFIENWLLVNGEGRSLINDNGMLKIKDANTNECFLAIQVPEGLLGAAGGVLEAGGSLIVM